ncbi:MAG: hypothetical protein K8W52_04475 [Deltaproteobacteria bacterium]|nr:hypothetical protein [Deltaproteobacteria bacterium]
MSAIDHVVDLGPLPASLDEFLALRERVGKDAIGGAALFALALVEYVADPVAHEPFVTVMLTMDHLVDDAAGYKGRRPHHTVLRNLRDRLVGKAHIARSYAQGTRFEDGYALPGAIGIKVRVQANSALAPDRAKVFVHSTGADSPRPVTLHRNDKGLWKVHEWSSLEVGVHAPGRAPVDDL